MSEDTEDRLKGFEPRSVRLAKAMRLVRITLGRVSQSSLEI